MYLRCLHLLVPAIFISILASQSFCQEESTGVEGDSTGAVDDTTCAKPAESRESCIAACDEQFPSSEIPQRKPTEEPDRKTNIAPHGWWTLGVGAALVVAGTVTGSTALKLNSDLKKECSSDGSCPPSYHDDLSSRNRLATASTITLATGFVFSVVGVLILTVFGKERETGEIDDTVGFGSWCREDNAGAVVYWRF